MSPIYYRTSQGRAYLESILEASINSKKPPQKEEDAQTSGLIITNYNQHKVVSKLETGSSFIEKIKALFNSCLPGKQSQSYNRV